MFGLLSAVAWGGGDFSGGLATRRASPFQVLALAALSGMAVLALFALLSREPFPHGEEALLAVLAGLAGSLALASLYQGLAIGNAAVVAPVSAVLGAGVPVAYSASLHGVPPPLQIAGFGAALTGIFLVSRSTGEAKDGRQRGLLLAVLAGLGFGVFFILMAEAGRVLIFTPLIVARGVMFLVAVGVILARRIRFPSPRANPVAVLAGVLDGGGNALYVLAGQFLRLDVAAVLASFFPATTVALAALILKEKVTRGQAAGTLLCLAAIVLITVSR